LLRNGNETEMPRLNVYLFSNKSLSCIHILFQGLSFIGMFHQSFFLVCSKVPFYSSVFQFCFIGRFCRSFLAALI